MKNYPALRRGLALIGTVAVLACLLVMLNSSARSLNKERDAPKGEAIGPIATFGGSLGIYEFAATRAPDTPLVYGHLFNTQWGTNFRQWHEGDFTFRYRLLPHAGDWRVGRLWQTAWETTRPCVAVTDGASADLSLG